MECWIVGILDDLPSSGTSNPITPILQYSNTPVLQYSSAPILQCSIILVPVLLGWENKMAEAVRGYGANGFRHCGGKLWERRRAISYALRKLLKCSAIGYFVPWVFRYLPSVLPAEGPDVVGFHLEAVEVVVEGFGVFEGEAVAVGEEVVESDSGGVDFASGVGGVVGGGHVGHHHGDVFVGAVDAAEELGSESGGDAEVVVEFFCGPSGGEEVVAEGVAVVIVTETNGGVELGSP